jgi:hypothetical protein
MAVAGLGHMTMDLKVLNCGTCEELKAGVHATALGLVAVMGLYNAAAWLTRRQRHLAFNALMYAVLAAWEQQHVAHHIAEIRIRRPPVTPVVPEEAPAVELPAVELAA